MLKRQEGSNKLPSFLLYNIGYSQKHIRQQITKNTTLKTDITHLSFYIPIHLQQRINSVHEHTNEKNHTKLITCKECLTR